MKKIIFPVTNAVEREKLRDFLINSMGDYMNADITTKTIAVLEVSYSENRKDIEELLMAIYDKIMRKRTNE